MKYQIIIPPLYETAITGFVCGGKKKIGKALWRVDVYMGESSPRLYRDDVQIAPHEGLPAKGQSLIGGVALLSGMIGKAMACGFSFSPQMEA